MWDNGYFLELPGKTLGKNDDIPAVLVGSPARFSETPAQPRDIGKSQCPPSPLAPWDWTESAYSLAPRAAPNEEGQDTVAVLGEIGLDGAEMKALAAEGTIHIGGRSKL